MTSKYLFDTSTIIRALQKQDKDIQKLIRKLSLETSIAISVLTITEIRAGLKGKQINPLVQMITIAFNMEEVSYSIAEKAGEILSKYPNNGISIGDAVIAATAILKEYTLITDDRNFKVIKELNCL
jgi:predicted nucleic acid-binding protein